MYTPRAVDNARLCVILTILCTVPVLITGPASVIAGVDDRSLDSAPSAEIAEIRSINVADALFDPTGRAESIECTNTYQHYSIGVNPCEALAAGSSHLKVEIELTSPDSPTVANIDAVLSCRTGFGGPVPCFSVHSLTTTCDGGVVQNDQISGILLDPNASCRVEFDVIPILFGIFTAVFEIFPSIDVLVENNKIEIPMEVLYTAPLTGFKFSDTNNNGVRDGGEPGLEGFTVFVDVDMDGVFDDMEPSTLTQSDGSYSIPLPVGSWAIREAPEAGWVQTFPADPNPYHMRTVTEVTTGVTADFGNYLLPNADLGCSAILPVCEGCPAGPNIALFDFQRPYSGSCTNFGPDPALVTFGVDLGTTGFLEYVPPDGFSCNGITRSVLCDGFLEVNQTVLMELNVTYAAGLSTPTTTLFASSLAFDSNPDNNVSNLDVQLYPSSTVSGLKFNDLNGNGFLDPGEPGMEGVKLFADWNDNGVQDENEKVEEVTGPDGVFALDGLYPFSFYLREVVPDKYTPTSPVDGRQLVSLSVPGGLAVEDVLFGNVGDPGGITGRKFFDLDKDGIPGLAEPGLAGFTIYVDLNNNGQFDTDEPSAVTGADGGYYIANVPSGVDIMVREVQKANSMQTYPVNGYHTLRLTPGFIAEAIDFGNYLDPGFLHGQKYFDRNGNSTYDAAESGINGWKIYLIDDRGAIVDSTLTMSMDTDGNGRIDPHSEKGWYWFLHVLPGNYAVKEEQRSGWVPTTSDSVSVVVQSNLEQLVFFGNDGRGLPEDWGDLPDPKPLPLAAPCTVPQCYPTVSPAGAVHSIVPLLPALGPLRMGNLIDDEPDGQPDILAFGDDQIVAASGSVDDEDGVMLLTFDPGGLGTVEVTVNGAPPGGAFLDAWIDFNDNGVLEDLTVESIITALNVTNGTRIINFPVPVDAVRGGYARFRISSSVFGTPPFGYMEDGEVEDYFMFAADYGDAQEADPPYRTPDFPTGYPVTLGQNGAFHIVADNIRLGDEIDADIRGAMPGMYAVCDDDFDVNDADGIVFLEGFSDLVIRARPSLPECGSERDLTINTMTTSTIVKIIPLPSVAGRLDAWIDWNRDGDWDDPGDQIFDNTLLSPAFPDTLMISVPADASIGFTYARFRFSLDGGLDFGGGAPDGEVEDYLLGILPALDLGDAPSPYPTLIIDGGAKHVISNSFLGVFVDPEADGHPLAAALGDDIDGIDDEDGLSIPNPLIRGATETITVNAGGSIGAILNAWLDFNHDGDWDDSGEQILTDESLSPGATMFDIFIPETALPGKTMTRFRYSTEAGLAPADTSYFLIYPGEVEDHEVELSQGTVGVEQEPGLPSQFSLGANYPNPFNPSTTLRYELAETVHVRLEVLDVLGRVVSSLVDVTQPAGRYVATFDAAGLPSGVYFYTLSAGSYRSVRKMLLIK